MPVIITFSGKTSIFIFMIYSPFYNSIYKPKLTVILRSNFNAMALIGKRYGGSNKTKILRKLPII
jgi:hypothetical protein